MIMKEILGSKMYLLEDDPGFSSEVMENEIREWGCPSFYENIIEPEMVVVDIGACLGYYALLAGKKGAKVYAIEPVPMNVRALRASIELNGYEVSVWEGVISDHDGPHVLGVYGHSNWGRLNAHDPVVSIGVEGKSLDSFCEGFTPDILRFDVEGAEIQVVGGGQSVLSRMRSGSWIFAEFHICHFEDTSGLRWAMENIIGHGFVPVYTQPVEGWVSSFDFIEVMMAETESAPRIFFQKV